MSDIVCALTDHERLYPVQSGSPFARCATGSTGTAAAKGKDALQRRFGGNPGTLFLAGPQARLWRSWPHLLLATTALVSVAMLARPALADSGASCVMAGGACVISTNGIDGIDGTDGSGDNPGNDGTMGTPADDVTTVIEDERNLTSSGINSPVNITAVGGRGGHGGNAGSPFPYTDRNRGGNGMPGSDGGALDVTLRPDTSGVASLGPLGARVSGVTLVSQGGSGGGGGLPTEQEGMDGAGVSATGGNGKSVTATVGGNWTSNPGAGLYALSGGGTGGEGKSTNVKLIKFGTNGGQGGRGGTVDVTITGTLVGLTYGAYVVSQGGHGGDGLSTDGAQGGNGGTGGPRRTPRPRSPPGARCFPPMRRRRLFMWVPSAARAAADPPRAVLARAGRRAMPRPW